MLVMRHPGRYVCTRCVKARPIDLYAQRPGNAALADDALVFGTEHGLLVGLRGRHHIATPVAEALRDLIDGFRDEDGNLVRTTDTAEARAA